MLRQLSVKSQLLGMLGGIVFLLVVFAAVVWSAVGSISGAADGMGQGKLTTLKKDYDDGNAFWERPPLDPGVRSALREQSAASTQIAQDVERIAQMTEENSAAVGEVSQSAERLQRLAASLKASVDQFKV